MVNEMSFRVINKGKDFIELEVLNYDNTILRPLVDELARDPMVLETKYHIEHPVIDNPTLYIKVKEGKPQAAIRRALKKIDKYFEEMEALLKENLS